MLWAQSTTEVGSCSLALFFIFFFFFRGGGGEGGGIFKETIFCRASYAVDGGDEAKTATTDAVADDDGLLAFSMVPLA